MDRNNTSQQREIVYCHQCENEWYQNEHGIICPECGSDFTEIIDEAREAEETRENMFPSLHERHTYPDPDEDDIDQVHWQQNGSNQIRGSFSGNIDFGPGQQERGQATGIQGIIESALRGVLGGGQQLSQDPFQEHGSPLRGGGGSPVRESGGSPIRGRGGSPMRGQGSSPGRSLGSSPGQTLGGSPGRTLGGMPSPLGSPRGNRGTFVQHGHGPGYSFSITTSTNSNLSPRVATQPQPFQPQPDHLDQMLRNLLMNIGANPGHPLGGQMPPFGDLFGLFGMPRGGISGDAVYSQQALDRVISDLMAQHQSGNAPPPASEEAINALKKRAVTQKDVSDNGKADCSICMDEAAVGSEVTELPCGHWFHFACIKAWLTEHDTCPHCRQGITPKDEAESGQPRQPDQAPLHDMHSPDHHRVPGEFPSSRQNSAPVEGSSRGWVRSGGSPTARRSSNSGGNGASPSGGMLSRMREAFAPSGSSSSTQRGRSGQGRGSSRDRR